MTCILKYVRRIPATLKRLVSMRDRHRTDMLSSSLQDQTHHSTVQLAYLSKRLSIGLDVVSSPQDHGDGLRPGVAIVKLLSL